MQRNEGWPVLARYIIVAAGSAFSVLLAPVRMLFHTVFVVSATSWLGSGVEFTAA
ncbi:hypothetical protein ACNKHL_06265 [Shigella flexneri]